MAIQLAGVVQGDTVIQLAGVVQEDMETLSAGAGKAVPTSRWSQYAFNNHRTKRHLKE